MHGRTELQYRVGSGLDSSRVRALVVSCSRELGAHYGFGGFFSDGSHSPCGWAAQSHTAIAQTSDGQFGGSERVDFEHGYGSLGLEM